MKGFWLILCLFGYMFSFGVILTLSLIGANPGAPDPVDPAHTMKWIYILAFVNIVVVGSTFAKAITAE